MELSEKMKSCRAVVSVLFKVLTLNLASFCLVLMD